MGNIHVVWKQDMGRDCTGHKSLGSPELVAREL